MLYGSEVWECERHPELERLQLKYIKWVLWLSTNTPIYIAMQEGKRVVNRGRWKGVQQRHVRKWWQLVQNWNKRKAKESKKEVGDEKIILRKRRAVNKVCGRQESIRAISGEDRNKSKSREKAQESWDIIRKEVSLLSQYLRKRWKSEDIHIIARFRCRNHEKRNLFWKKQ